MNSWLDWYIDLIGEGDCDIILMYEYEYTLVEILSNKELVDYFEINGIVKIDKRIKCGNIFSSRDDKQLMSIKISSKMR